MDDRKKQMSEYQLVSNLGTLMVITVYTMFAGHEWREHDGELFWAVLGSVVFVAYWMLLHTLARKRDKARGVK
jgi:predicted acyltransferase